MQGYSMSAFTTIADYTCYTESCMTFRILCGGQKVSGGKAKITTENIPAHLTTEDNRAYGVIDVTEDNPAYVMTEDNPAYGMSGSLVRHEKTNDLNN